MKKLIFGIALMILGGLVVGFSLLALSNYHTGANQYGSYDTYRTMTTFSLIIGSIISVVGIIFSITEILKSDK